MPLVKGNRISVTMYLLPETFEAIESSRDKHISSSAYCASLLDGLVGVKPV